MGRDISLAAFYSSIVHTLPVTHYYEKFYAGIPEIPSVRNSSFDDADYSVWFNHFDSDPNQIPLNEATVLDNILRPIFRASSRYSAIYYGGQTGLLYAHPWSDKSHYPNLSYTCLKDNSPTVGYDPTCRSWYIRARDSLNKVRFTEPYTDAGTGNVLISASKSVDANPSSPFVANEGVLASDLSMQHLEEELLGQTVRENGYSALVDVLGNAVVYPAMDRTQRYSLVELEFAGDEANRSEFSSLFDSVVSSPNHTGLVEYWKSSTLRGRNATDAERNTATARAWVMAYSKVTGTDYIVLLLAPMSDVTKATDDIESQAVTGIVVGSVLLGALLILVLLLSTVTNRKIGQRVTQPILQATAVFSAIGEGNLQAEVGKVQASIPEYEALFALVGKLLSAVRFNNPAYLQEDSRQALRTYEQVEEMVKEIGNHVALGAVLNNKAVALQQLRAFEQAEDCFLQGIANAADLSANAGKTGNRHAESAFRIKLAQRHANLGRLYPETSEFSKAVRHLKKSIQIYSAEKELLGLNRTRAQLGLTYVHPNHPKPDAAKAHELVFETYTFARDRYRRKPSEKNATLLQYAAESMGQLFVRLKNPPAALQFFNLALSRGETIDASLRNSCLGRIAQLRGKKLRGTQAIGPKHITFVLDCSGSMDGPRITTCRGSISDILQNSMTDADTASLYTFNHQVACVFPAQAVGKHRDRMLRDVAFRTKPQSTTAFYDALFTAIQEKGRVDNKWVVALTDGDDNASKHTANEVAELAQKLKAALIVITVGELKSATTNNIQHILECAEKAGGRGLQFAASNAPAIAKAFEQAIEEIQGGANLEQL